MITGCPLSLNICFRFFKYRTIPEILTKNLMIVISERGDSKISAKNYIRRRYIKNQISSYKLVTKIYAVQNGSCNESSDTSKIFKEQI